MKLRLEDIHTKPQDWLEYMEKKENELNNAGHFMDNETYLAYVLVSLPQEEPSNDFGTKRSVQKRYTIN